MIKYIVECKKWFDKINGNTYFSLIIRNHKQNIIIESPFNYGYGEQYRHETIAILIKKGLWKEEDKNNHDLIREKIYFSCADVTRKKDL